MHSCTGVLFGLKMILHWKEFLLNTQGNTAGIRVCIMRTPKPVVADNVENSALHGYTAQ